MASNGQNILTHKCGRGRAHWPGNCMIRMRCKKRFKWRGLRPMG